MYIPPINNQTKNNLNIIRTREEKKYNLSPSFKANSIMNIDFLKSASLLLGLNIEETAHFLKEKHINIDYVPDKSQNMEEWARFVLDMPISEEFDSNGKISKKIYGENSYRKYHNWVMRDYQRIDRPYVSFIKMPNGIYIEYSRLGGVTEIGNEETGEYTKYEYMYPGIIEEEGNKKTGEYKKYNSGSLKEEGNTKTGVRIKWSMNQKTYEKYVNEEYMGKYNADGTKVEEPNYWNFNIPPVTNSNTVSLEDGEEQFVESISELVARGGRMSTVQMIDFAKLVGLTYEEILHMNKDTYKSLCSKYHPDRNKDNPLAEKICAIVVNYYRQRSQQK